MKLRRVMIAAPKSGSGKTTITCALIKSLKEQGENVVSYKCGPDYIDPMFHRQIIGVPSKNLDTFFTDEKTTLELFLKDRKESDSAVLEGVMGLYDGLGGIKEEGSSYHLAKVTQTPIILVVDAKGMGRSVISMIAGFLSYDRERLIKGVILNRMSEPYFKTIKPLIEDELNIAALGFFPEKKDIRIESRHLGLMLPGEISDIRNRLQIISEELSQNVSVDKIKDIAGSAKAVWVPEKVENISINETFGSAKEVWLRREAFVDGKEKEGDLKHYAGNASAEYELSDNDKPVIAVAMDEAFCFYYEDNLRLLREFGAQIKYFSPLHDKKLPDGCSALLIGGGYPEVYAEALSSNVCMRMAVRQAYDSKMPVVAECGGFMYLHDAIVDKEGVSHAMAGAISGTCSYTGRLVRFGYIELKEKQGHFLPAGETIRGHEFHYFDSTNNGQDCTAVKPVTGKEYSCVIVNENCWLGFAHLYYPSNPEFAKSFVRKAEFYKEAFMENSHRFFENRECKYFPCHKGLSDFNCLFCYCPMYNLEHCPGNPRFIDKGERKIKDCSNCTFPHKPENYEKVIEVLKMK